MEITLLYKLIISILAALVIGTIVGFVVKRGKDAKVGLGCGLMFPISFGVFIVLQSIISDVVIITYRNGDYQYCTKTMIGSIKMASGKSFKISLSDKYIANYSDDPLICYKVFYGTDKYYNTLKEEDPIIIEPNTVIKIEHLPDYYFRIPPDQITSKTNGWESKWVLDRMQTR